jgi:pimeloyl-ACP methyl ester carboxylesterase
MEHFSQKHNIPCYAVSYRGHGASWYPNFLRMVYFTTKRMLANDLVAGVKEATRRETERTGKTVEVVLVGHSSGGGLSQLILSDGDVRVKGLALCGAIPGFGS